MQPGDDVAPDLVAVPRERTERLLADGDRQHEVVGRIGRRGRDRACKRRSVLGHGVAAAAEEGLLHGVGTVEHQRLPVDAVGAAIVAERHLMRGALRHADGRALQILQLLDAGVLLHDETLAVVEIDRALPQTKRRAAQEGLGRVAIEHVDLARLQRGEAVLRGERDIAHLAGIAEHAGSERLAVVDVEALEVALRVRRGKPGKAGRDAAHQRAALLDRIQCRGLCARNRCGKQTGRQSELSSYASPSLSD